MEFKGTKGKWHMMKKGFDRKQNQNLIQIYATNEDLEMVCQVWNDGILHSRTQNYDAVIMDNGTTLKLTKPTLEKCSVESYLPFGVDFSECEVIDFN